MRATVFLLFTLNALLGGCGNTVTVEVQNRSSQPIRRADVRLDGKVVGTVTGVMPGAERAVDVRIKGDGSVSISVTLGNGKALEGPEDYVTTHVDPVSFRVFDDRVDRATE